MFYENLQKLCKDRHTSPSAVAARLGYSNATASKWKKGSIPKRETLLNIAEYFGVTVDYLLDGGTTSTNIRTGNISNSAVVQGNTGNNITVSNGAAPAAAGLSEQETELLRIFRSLDTRGQTAVMSCLYEQEERQSKK